MEMEAVISRIAEQIKKAGTTSQNSPRYKCMECSDTGWVKTVNDSYRKCSCTGIKSAKSCWVNFGVKPEDVKPLQQYNAYNKTTAALKSKAVDYIKNFNNMLNSENNWFGIFGQPGSGKSHVAVAIGAALLNRNEKPIKAVYMPYLEVMRQLKANTLDDEYYINLLNRYQRAQVLIIDDLFKDKVKRGKLAFDLTEADIKHIYPIINYRYVNKMPTIISSECTPDMLLDLDRALCGRLLDRCDENITVFVGEEFDYRMRRFERGRN